MPGLVAMATVMVSRRDRNAKNAITGASAGVEVVIVPDFNIGIF